MPASRSVSRFLSWLPALALMAVIFGLSSIPGDEVPLPHFRFSDKAAHFLAYAVLGLLIGLRKSLRPGEEAAEAGLPPSSGPSLRAFDWRGAAVGIPFGLSDEVHQIFVPLRLFSLSDLAADALGVLAGLWAYARYRRLMGTRLASPPLRI